MKQIYRFILFSITLLLLINSTFIISNAKARNYIFTTESSLSIIPGTDEFGILEPEGSGVTTQINITYEYKRFARPNGFPFPNKKEPTKINLSIESKPEWCSVELDKESFEAPVTTFIRSQIRKVNFSANLTVRIISEKAPAFTKGEIIINATAEQNGNVLASSAKSTITIKPDFVPNVTATISNLTLEIKSGEETNVSITVKNTANSKISAKISLNMTESDHLTIYPPLNSNSIEINDEATFLVKISAHESDEEINETQNITFIVTYYASGHETTTSNSLYLHLKTNIQSEKQVTGLFDFDFELIIMAMAIVLVITMLLIIYVVYRRRRR